MRLSALALAASLAGCYQTRSDFLDCGLSAVPDGPMELEVLELEWNREQPPAANPLSSDAASLRLQLAPGSGWAMLVGALIKNAGSCKIVLTSSLRDPHDDEVATHSGRSLAYRAIPDRPGWAEPAGASVGDWADFIPGCFNYADRDLDGCAWTLEVTARDELDREASDRRTVVPVCTTPEDPDWAGWCECECAARFDLRDCRDLAPWVPAPPPECGP